MDAVRSWLDGGSDPSAEEELRRALEERLGPDWLVRTTASGRTALQMALEAFELPSQAHVILPSYACMGVVAPVVQAGLRPLFVDIDPDLCISSESVAETGERDVGAVIVPHLGGQMAAGTDTIVDWAQARGIPVIDDAAQNFGLEGAGESGDVAIFSSGGGKPLFGPGGGWIATRRGDLAERISAQNLRAEPRGRLPAALACSSTSSRPPRASARGASSEPWSHGGFSDRPPHPRIADRRDRIFRCTRSRTSRRDWRCFSSGSWIKSSAGDGKSGTMASGASGTQSSIRLAPAEPNVHTKLWISTEGDALELERVRSHFARYGIETETLYTPLHMRPGLMETAKVPLPNTERLWSGICSLPARPNLDEADWERISAAVDALVPRAGGAG